MIKSLVVIAAIFIAVPDVYIPLSSTKLRIDDLAIYTLGLFWLFKGESITRNYYGLWMLNIFAVFSYLINTLVLTGAIVDSYYIFRCFGSIPYLYVLMIIIRKSYLFETYTHFFFITAIIFLSTLLWNYSRIDFSLISKSAHFKRSISMSSINPNALGNLSIIIGGVNLYVWSLNKFTRNLLVGLLTLMVPFFVFARGASIGVIGALSFYYIMNSRKNRFFRFSIVVMALTTIWIVLLQTENQIILSAIDIDINSGKGFSGRYDVWNVALELFKLRPVLGNGFLSSNWAFHNLITSTKGGVAHNLYLTLLLECGIIGFLFFFGVLFRLVLRAWNSYNIKQSILSISLIFGMLLYNVSAQDFYFTKHFYLLLLPLLHSISYAKEN